MDMNINILNGKWDVKKLITFNKLMVCDRNDIGIKNLLDAYYIFDLNKNLKLKFEDVEEGIFYFKENDIYLQFNKTKWFKKRTEVYNIELIDEDTLTLHNKLEGIKLKLIKNKKYE